MPILEITIGAATAGAALIGTLWKVHSGVVKKTTEHEQRLANIEHTNDIQEIKITNIEKNHGSLDQRMANIESTVVELKIQNAEILQILKGGLYGKATKNVDR
ncbi:hypothetical protein [Buttiauxella noackiae]|uniref:hypothetical protein n=1 Tax=Buttiauxella noackiae TaxID=82992 RepID=UPI00054DB11E|nr:hypothetical protein [Buttiauxella noackiae]